MNKWIVAAGLLIAAFTNSCSTDFDLNADYKETPVVYALFDASEDTQYIRINRAFLSDEIDALTMSTDPNAIYYGDELKVTVEEYNGGTLINTYIIPRVNGEDYGIPKQPGIFADAPNILYLFTADLDYTQSIDSLACGKITEQLNFVSSYTNPAYPGCGF